MELDFNYRNLKINRKVYEQNYEFILNQDVIVPDIKPDILEVLHKNASISIERNELNESMLKINGISNVEFIYMADNENNDVRGLSTEIELNQSIELPCRYDNMIPNVKGRIKSLDCKIVNERKILVTVCIICNVCIELNEEINYIGGCNSNNDIQILNNEMDISSLICSEMQNISVNEDIIIDNDNVCELLESSVKIINQEHKLSYNKILVKSDARINLVFSTNENDIFTKQVLLPLTGFIDMQGINDNSILEIDYSILNKSIKFCCDGDTKKVAVNMEVSVFVKNFENSRISIIEDMYSLTRGIDFEKNIIDADRIMSSKVITHCVNENILLEDINCNVYDVDISIIRSESKQVNDKLHIEGDMKIELMCKNSNKIFMKTYEMPFSHVHEDSTIKNGKSYDVEVDVQNVNYQLNNNSIDLNVYMCFKITIKTVSNLNIITNIKETEVSNCANDSITIYYVKTGDSLWSIAKKFATTIEEIAKYNDINIDDILLPDIQLFIPKKVIRKAV